MAWEDYLYWQQNDKQILKKINQLIKDIKRDPFEGIGKPEPLKYELSGFWSRRITDEHRLVYQFDESGLSIASCRFHY
jgi:toxin YoeB